MFILAAAGHGAAPDPLEHVTPHYLFKVGPVGFTNQMLMALVAGVLMVLIFPALFRRRAPGDDVPTGSRNFLESILEFLRVEVFRPALKEHTDRFVPFLWTVFFFILFCNLLGQLPINELVTVLKYAVGNYDDSDRNHQLHEAHFAGTATGTVATTGALALCAFFAIHLSGILQVGRALIYGTYGHHDHHEEHSADGVKPGHEAAQDLDHGRGDALAADVPGDMRAITDPTKHYHDDEYAGRKHAAHGAPPGAGHDPAHGGDLAYRHTAHGLAMDPGRAFLLAVPLYLWNFAPHPFKPGPGESALKWIPDVIIWALLLVLELIGAAIKPFALMIRLFANMIAGHIVLAALILLIPVAAGAAAQIGVGAPVTLLSLLIRTLELFVAFLQAYIFTFLTTLFIASAVAPEH